MRGSNDSASSLRSLLGFVLAIAIAGFAGCGSANIGSVTGTVTLDGQPVPGLEVNFEPVDSSLGTTATGYTQPDGKYQLFYPGGKTEIPAGEYTVRIVAAEIDDAGPPVQIPAKYNSQSELKKTVTSGESVIDIPLTSS